MRLRQGTRADAAAIAALHAESWRFAYRGIYPDEYLDGPVIDDRVRVWAERFTAPPPGQFVVVAEDDGELVGFACAFGESDETWGTLVDNLHVRPDRLREGTGRRLLGEIARWCLKTYPGRPMHLWVLEQNDRAQRFYGALAADHEGSRVTATPGVGQTVAWRMVWPPAKLAELAKG